MIGRPVREPLTGVPGFGAVMLALRFPNVISWPLRYPKHRWRPAMTTHDRPTHPAPRGAVRARGRRDAAAHDAAGCRAAEALPHRRAQPRDPGALPHHGRLHPQLRTGRPARPRGVIHRTTARNGCEYEWGVHAAAFGRPLGLTGRAAARDGARRRGRPRLVGAPVAAGAARRRAARHGHRVRRRCGRGLRRSGSRPSWSSSSRPSASTTSSRSWRTPLGVELEDYAERFPA